MKDPQAVAEYEDQVPADVMAQAQAGAGVRLSTIDSNLSSGGIETTGNPTDLAINGSGLFILQSPSGPV